MSNIEDMTQISKEVQNNYDLNLNEIIYNLFEKDLTITVEISKDSKFSSQMKDKLLREF